jgi:hypothetical protein
MGIVAKSRLQSMLGRVGVCERKRFICMGG